MMAGELRRYGVANARVRGLLSTLLGRSGLEALCGYPSSDAVLDALVRTPYAVCVAGLTASDHALLRRLADVGRLVLGVLEETERAFVRQFLLQHEVASLKVLIRAVAQHLPAQAVAPYLVDWHGITTLAAQELAGAHDLRDLVERLEHTPYATALRAARHRIDSAGPFALEVALELDYYDRLWLATASLRPSDRECARHLVGILFDILNLSWIARYRRLALSAEEILNYTLRQGRWVTFAIRRALAETRDASWPAALAHTPYAALLGDVTGRSFDAASVTLWRFLAGEVQRSLTGYPFHIGVPLGFLLAQEIEIRDLRVLLAAKGMGVAGPEILDHLATVRH
jgi:vacuolar-type H+-ATPase subunit C/Vma6